MLTPGKLILPVPSKLTPPIFLAVSNAVAVAAFPVVVVAMPALTANAALDALSAVFAEAITGNLAESTVPAFKLPAFL